MNKTPLFKPYFRKKKLLSECLDIGWTKIRYKTDEFEKFWCVYSKFNHRHVLNSTDSKINNSPLHLNLSYESVSCISSLANKFTL